MIKRLLKTTAISTIILIISNATINASQITGAEYSLTMDIEYVTSTVLKNIQIESPYITKKKVDTDFKMLLINGNLLLDSNIITKNNRTLVPIRVISENTNSEINWNNKTRKVTINKDNTSIELTIDKKEALVNSNKITLDVAPEIINNYTYLPIRFVSENMGCEVEYMDTKKGGSEDFANNDFPFFFPTVIVEEKNTNNFNTSNKALENLKNKLISSIDDYKKYLSEAYDSESVDTYISSLKSKISKITYKGDVGRYYIFSSYAGTYLVNKYTDEMYISKGSMTTRNIYELERVYPDVFYGLAN